MKHLQQSLNTDDDSFTYTVRGETEHTYLVDSGAKLYERGVHIGDYRLQADRWDLYVNGELYMQGPANGLFKLPEFELRSLTALVNQERPSAL